MPDVVDVLRNLPHAVTPDQTSPDVVAADVARGHRAVTRRRRQRFVFSSAAVVVVAAAVAVGAGQIGQPGGAASLVAEGPDATTVAEGAGTTTQASLQLVAYTGTQPAGFEVSTVPEGWEVTSSNATTFVVTPPGHEGPPGIDGQVLFDGRIMVALQGESRFPDESPVTKVDINGREGQLGFSLQAIGELSETRWLIFPDASGQQVLVQVPGELGLSDDQIVHFAEGITVTDDAVATRG